MARDDDAWKRFREREDEAEAERQAEFRKKANITGSAQASEEKNKVDPVGDEVGDRVSAMIDQVNNLYQMYFTGVEKRVPIEKRKQLEQMVQAYQSTPRLTPSAQFKFNNMMSRYNTHKDRWDKMLKDLESGKIKRG